MIGLPILSIVMLMIHQILIRINLDIGSVHNINAEIGLDLIFPDRYSIFLIYERNQAINSGHNDNLYIAIGYLPYEGAEYAFTINGSENLIIKVRI